MKSLFLCLATAFAVIIVSSGCSDRAAQPAPAVEQKAAGDGYQTALPAAFISKAIQADGRCFVDDVNGQPPSAHYEVSGNRPLTIDGWVTGSAATVPPVVAVELASGGAQSYYAPAQRVNRPGLGQALKNPAFDQAGLQSTAALSGVAPGSYSVRLLAVGEQGANRCDPNVLVVIK